MAGSTEKLGKEKSDKTRRRRKEEKHLSDQLEEKYIGAKTEVFSRISAKEAEIRSKTSSERTKADRLIEDAKGQAAALKRKATMEEIGKDVHAKILADAQMKVSKIADTTAEEVTVIEKNGKKNLEQAVDYIINAITTTGF